MEKLGDRDCIPDDVEQACRTFIYRLYGQTLLAESLNLLRSQMAKRKIRPKLLPPTESSFVLHLQRAIIQLRIWRLAHHAWQVVSDPTKFGYTLHDNGVSLVPVLLAGSVAAPELLNDLVCECEGQCDYSCICFIHKQPCTSACKCTATDITEDEDCFCNNIYTVLPDICIDED